VPVLFAPELARGLIGHFIAAIRGGALYRKSSFLLDRLGTPVFPDFVTLRERPHLPKALGSAPFDSEGVATADRDVVSDGVLRGTCWIAIRRAAWGCKPPAMPAVPTI
jgi:PmbA protein